MNTQHKHSPAAPRPLALAPAPARRDYPQRDFGIGYGRSSGYATSRRYVQAWNGQPRFRCI